MFEAPWCSHAIAALTQESIPPLKSTTAFLWSIPFTTASTSSAPFFLTSLTSNSLGGRIPDKFVQLQPEPHRQIVRQHPFDQHARVQARPLPLRILERRRKQNLSHSPCQAVLQGKIARKFVVAPSGKHELHLVVIGQSFEIAHLESIRIAGIRAFHIHNLDH